LTHTYDDMTLDELRRRVDDWAHYGIEPSTPREWYIARRARRDAILDLQEALDAEGLVVMSGPMIERLLADAYDCGILYARGFNRDADHG
jgi:hypothetical protein